MKHTLPLILLTLLSASSLSLPAAQAQASFNNDEARLEELSLSPFALQRAKNQARQLAERLNGGLDSYRSEASMHGPSAESPYRITESGEIEFHFLGRAPGESTYTVETVVIVNPETGELEVTYNGERRSQAQTRF